MKVAFSLQCKIDWHFFDRVTATLSHYRFPDKPDVIAEV